jgi:hypothetical protein
MSNQPSDLHRDLAALIEIADRFAAVVESCLDWAKPDALDDDEDVITARQAQADLARWHLERAGQQRLTLADPQ